MLAPPVDQVSLYGTSEAARAVGSLSFAAGLLTAPTHLRHSLDWLRRFLEKVLLRRVWVRLAPMLLKIPGTETAATRIHRRIVRLQPRTPSADYTRFLRNQPQLEVLRRIVVQEKYSSLKLAVLGCSNGAELYSAVWAVRSARPDLALTAVGLDISHNAIDQAKARTYSLGTEVTGSVPESIARQLFVRDRDKVIVREEYARDIRWLVQDVCTPDLETVLGLQDVVFANNFLIHLTDSQAEDCLRSILRLLAPGGFLFVWGVNLDLKTTVLSQTKLIPWLPLLKEVYQADTAARILWPWKYWSLEPLDTRRSDWEFRYTTVYRLPSTAPSSARGG